MAGHLLDRAPIRVSGQKVHPAVRAGGIPQKDLLDVADAFEEAAPIQRRAESEARDRVGHRDLIGGLSLSLDANRIFRGHTPGRQPGIDLFAHANSTGSVLADALEHSHRERQTGLVLQGRHPSPIGRVERGQVGIRQHEGISHVAHSCRQVGDIANQRELESTRPGPELADGQRRRCLKREEKPLKAFGIQPAVAVADDLPGQHLDAGGVRGIDDAGQATVVAGRKVAA